MQRHLTPWFAGLSLLLAAGCGASSQPPAGPSLAASQIATIRADRVGPAQYRVYQGITHTHVAENGDDGQGTLSEAYEFARNRAKLDFLAVSSHSHMITDEGYRVMKAAAKAYTSEGKFVALLAQEWSSISKGGHINIFEANERCPLPNGAWDDFYQRWLPNHPEVGWVQFNHPHPSNPLEFGGLSFSPVLRAQASVVALDKVTGIALLNGPGKYEKPDMKGEPDDWDRGVNHLNYEVEYTDYLNRGWRLGALGDQDNHVKNWGLATPTRTGIWARALDRRGVVEAMQARRTFASFDPNLSLWLSIGNTEMGGTLPSAGEATALVEVADPDSTIQRVELFADLDGVGGKPAQIIAKQAVGAKGARWKIPLPAARPGGYFFAKVVYHDNKAWAWSSPIWVGGAASRDARRP
ncbi:MAG: CehA/McbA family metallohydrolase [Candidatus Sericytochromatia bacterium]|nr:CehA/McbA family metallohydrolase [Candidatus Sericytochromatia bacterium]